MLVTMVLTNWSEISHMPSCNFQAPTPGTVRPIAQDAVQLDEGLIFIPRLDESLGLEHTRLIGPLRYNKGLRGSTASHDV